MGFYLNVMPGDEPPPADIRARLKQAVLADGGWEKDGGIFFAGAMVIIPTDQAVDTRSVIASFRLSWATVPNDVRLFTDRLSRLCARLGLKFDDGTGVKRDATPEAADDLVDFFAQGSKCVLDVFPPVADDTTP